MSAFLSNKLLKYRGLLNEPKKPIGADRLCPGCGYNLRGLMMGGNCPECGRGIQVNEVSRDMLVAGDIAQRRLLAIGLALLALSPLAAAAWRIAYPLACSLIPGPQDVWLYVAGAGVCGATWSVGVWMVTSRRIGSQHPRLAWLRLVARVTQLLWAPAYAAWVVSEIFYPFAGINPAIQLFIAMIVPARLGVLAAGAWLLVLAEDAELDEATPALNLSLWLAPILSLLVMFVPLNLPWFGQALMMAVLLPWAWYIARFSAAVWRMHRHVVWSIHGRGDARDRSVRISQTRAELQARVDSNVRPLPPPPPAEDMPLADPLEAADER